MLLILQTVCAFPFIRHVEKGDERSQFLAEDSAGSNREEHSNPCIFSVKFSFIVVLNISCVLLRFSRVRSKS